MSRQSFIAAYGSHCVAGRALPRSKTTFKVILLQVLLTLTALALLPCNVQAQSALTDDADVSFSSGSSNHGTNPNLNVSSRENVYLKFKLSSTLPAGTPGTDVAKATIKLYVGKIQTPGKLDLYAVAAPWIEDAINGNNPPPLGALITTTTQIGMDQSGKFLVIEITSLVRQWLGDDGLGANGIPNNGLAILAHSADTTTPEVARITFDSKENSQTSHEAQLNIQLSRAGDGLQQVERDATLVGDGTSASPLGVAIGGIDTAHLADGAVIAEKIAEGAVTSAQLANGAVTSAKITAPLSLMSADANATLLVTNTGPGAAITANGAINTTAQYNIAGEPVLSTRGTANIFVGIEAGRVNTTGRNNSFVGRFAGWSNTTGISNSFFGFGAGTFNTTGITNSYFGSSAGGFGVAGSNNSFFGFSAGVANTADQNSFFGSLAGRNNTSGQFNSFFGWAVGERNTTGSNNSFFGANAGDFNTEGSHNSFFGVLAGRFNSTGSFNSFFGKSAGQDNTTGFSNSFFGGGAGGDNTTGNDNSFFGNGAGFRNTTACCNSFFGAGAGRENTSGAGNSYFGWAAGSANETGSENTFFGNAAGFLMIGDGNSFFGSGAGAGNLTGSNLTSIGKSTAIGANNLTNATAIGAFAQVTQSNSLVLGSISGINFATASTNVGIGTTAPKTKLHVASGKIYVEENGQGIILRSPNGPCFELTVTNAGALTTAAVPCP